MKFLAFNLKDDVTKHFFIALAIKCKEYR